MIKAILFDLDGTLLDTNQLILESFKHTFKTVLNIELPEEELGKIFGKPLIETLAYYNSEKVDELVSCYREYNEEKHDNMCNEFEGVTELLKTLKENGYKLGIVTSKRREMAERGCRIAGIMDFFDTFMTPETTEKHKPHGEPVLKACEELNIEAHEAIMVGDAPSDILSGKNAGAKTCGVKYTALPISELEQHSPDFFIETPLQLIEVINSINKVQN